MNIKHGQKAIFSVRMGLHSVGYAKKSKLLRYESIMLSVDVQIMELKICVVMTVFCQLFLR